MTVSVCLQAAQSSSVTLRDIQAGEDHMPSLINIRMACVKILLPTLFSLSLIGCQTMESPTDGNGKNLEPYVVQVFAAPG